MNLKLSITKSSAYVLAVLLLAALGAIEIVFGKTVNDTLVTGIVSLTLGYIGLNIANNGVKGKCWNQQLYDTENGGQNVPKDT